jgi:hypothetical protein
MAGPSVRLRRQADCEEALCRREHEALQRRFLWTRRDEHALQLEREAHPGDN